MDGGTVVSSVYTAVIHYNNTAKHYIVDDILNKYGHSPGETERNIWAKTGSNAV